MSKKILITGSNGLLGQKLVALISTQEGYELVATARGEDRLPKGLYDYKYRPLDCTNIQQVYDVIGEERPDYVIHTMAMTNVDQCETERDLCWMMNVRATENVVEACRQTKAFLVHLSTDFIFDGQDGPYDEEAKPLPISFYGDSKLAAERVVFKSPIEWAVLRTVLVYGVAHDMSRSNIVLWVKSSLEAGKPITVVTDQIRTPTLAEDLAMGCLLAVKNHKKGIFNISGSDLMTPYEMAIRTADVFGLDKSLITATDGSKFQQTAKRPPRTGFIIDKAIQELGYKPHTFEEGIKVMASQLSPVSK